MVLQMLQARAGPYTLVLHHWFTAMAQKGKLAACVAVRDWEAPVDGLVRRQICFLWTVKEGQPSWKAITTQGFEKDAVTCELC
eukprot:g32643.t1